MKVRPWPLIILAILQFFSPVATVFFNAAILDVKPIYVLRWILEKSPLQVFEVLFLMPIAGLAILQMKRWSYIVFFVAMSWSLVSELQKFHYTTATISPWLVALVYALPIGLAVYFMIPSVRQTYLDPRVRWWEAKRRFLLASPTTLSSEGNLLHGRMENISEGGAFLLQEGKPLEIGRELRLRFQVISEEFSVPVVVMYCIQRPAQPPAYGVRFLHSPQTRRQFRKLARALNLIGIAHRDADFVQPWYEGIRDWAITVLKTGKGLVPDVKGTQARKKA